MKDLITVIAKALVDHPDDVVVRVTEDADEKTYHLAVHKEDIGKVIGRQGRIAKAIRIVVTSAAAKEQKRISVEIDS